MLLKRGDWPGTILPIHACARPGCVTFPRYVKAIRKMNVCFTPVESKNMWWNFLPAETYRRSSCPWLGIGCTMQSQFQTPVFSDMYGEGRYVRVYLTDIRDVGRTITIFGEDNNGQPYQETFSLVAPSVAAYVQSSRFVRRIDRVLKDRTKGRVILVGSTGVGSNAEEIATYDASETNPSYLRVSLNIPSTSCSSGTSSCSNLQSIAALVKFRFIPAVDPTDLVLIEDLDALELMIQSIRCSQGNDEEGRMSKEAAAIRELNLSQYDYSGDDAIVVTDDPFNGVTGLGFQKVF